VIGNAGASVVLVGAVSHQLGPGVGLCVLLLAGAGGNALTAVAHGTHHASVGASTAIFGAIGILAATRVVSRGRRPAARKLWMVVAASLALLALLGTSPGSDLLAHLFGLLLGGALGLAAALALPRPLRPQCSGRSPWPSWRWWSARGYALSPETTAPLYASSRLSS